VATAVAERGLRLWGSGDKLRQVRRPSAGRGWVIEPPKSCCSPPRTLTVRC